MVDCKFTDEWIKDYVTGQRLPVDEHEEVRQDIERFLVEKKGFGKKDIQVNGRLVVDLEKYREQIRLDLLVFLNGVPIMLFKTASGSIVSRERETLSAARLAADHQIPISIVTNGHDAEIFDTVSGKIISRGLDSIPDKKEAVDILKTVKLIELPSERRIVEQRVLLAYSSWKCSAD